MVEFNSCNRDHCSVAHQAENTYSLTLDGESLPTPGLCWNSKSAQHQWFYLMTNTNPSAGTGSWNHHPQPQPRLLTVEYVGSNSPWDSPSCSLLYWTLIACLACLAACQKYVSETAFPFVMLNLTFPFQPLSGSFHPTSPVYLKTKLIIILAALKLWCETYRVYLLGV